MSVQSLSRGMDFTVQIGLDCGLTLNEAERQAQNILLLEVEELVDADFEED